MDLIDTHSHLEEIKDLDQALKRAEKVGLVAVITMGSDHESNIKSLKISEKYKDGRVKVYPCLGVHPWNLSNNTMNIESTLRFIERKIGLTVGIGEIGLDYWLKTVRKDPEKREIQRYVFKRLLEIAKDNIKPVSIHSRGSWEDCIKIVREMKIKNAIFHWYSGPTNLLSELLKESYISVTPAAAYSKKHRETIRKTTIDRMMLETDSPVNYRGEIAEPAHIIKSMVSVKELKGLDTESIADITTKNAKRVFKI